MIFHVFFISELLESGKDDKNPDNLITDLIDAYMARQRFVKQPFPFFDTGGRGADEAYWGREHKGP
ncbi:uncharacterized protein Dmul_12750 [Desulfococcus multivorans]|nr:uncharacterized protein Dmul_12750 [Desulfococcus multivorans]